MKIAKMEVYESMVNESFLSWTINCVRLMNKDLLAISVHPSLGVSFTYDSQLVFLGACIKASYTKRLE